VNLRSTKMSKLTARRWPDAVARRLLANLRDARRLSLPMNRDLAYLLIIPGHNNG
jgi:hypothetical protein